MGASEIALLKFLVGISATALLLHEMFVPRGRSAGRAYRGRDATLVVLGLVGALSWWNFFQLQERGFLQGGDHFHYFLGAKYFPELGYTRLYTCTAIAEANAVPWARVRGRSIRDLESNRMMPIGAAVQQPERCTSHFTPERWQEFQQDVAWFRGRIAARNWRWFVMDHGYNAPPAWGVFAIPLANALDLSFSSLTLASRIDPVLQLISWSAVFWAFGWRIACIGLVVWGANGLREFNFIGGGYLRQGWLCAAVVGLCALRRERRVAAGALLTLSALLRVFPVFILLALGLKALWEMWKSRSCALPRAYRQLAAGGLLTVAVVVPLTGATCGFESWRPFLRNIRLHHDTPLTNYVGLWTLAAYDAANPAPDDSDASITGWAGRRADAQARHAGWVWLMFLVYLALFGRAVARSPDWVVAALGVGGVFVFLEITAYYYSAIIALVLLHERVAVAGPLLCLFAAISVYLGSLWMSTDPTFAYFAMSVPLAVVVLVLTWGAGRPARTAAVVP